MMTIGDAKGPILDRTVTETKPMVGLELGTYVGYSTIRIRQHMPKGSMLITLDVNEQFLDIAKQIGKFSGLMGKIDYWLGSLEKHVDRLVKEYGKIDFVFLDHWKDLYISDLKLLESKNLLKKGSCILADNVLYPGAPEFREYVAFSPKYITVEHGGENGYTRPKIADIVTVSIF